MESNRGQVKVVLFDLGGTLVKIDNSEIPCVMRRMLEGFGISRSLEEITQAWVKADEELDLRDLAQLLDEFWVRWNLRILHNLRVKPDSKMRARFIATHWWDYSRVTLHADAEKTLPQLKERGLKMGVISNGLQSDVDKILHKVGLQDFFDVVVVVDTLRKMKPDVEVFHYALEELESAPSEAVFIGDEIETDYKGAQRCGLAVYLIDREGEVQDDNVNRISSLEDLFEPDHRRS